MIVWEGGRVMVAWISVLAFLAIAAAIGGVTTYTAAPTISQQQVAALLMFLISAVFLVGTLIVGLLFDIHRQLRSNREALEKP
jgi:hypothetical protein